MVILKFFLIIVKYFFKCNIMLPLNYLEFFTSLQSIFNILYVMPVYYCTLNQVFKLFEYLSFNVLEIIN